MKQCGNLLFRVLLAVPIMLTLSLRGDMPVDPVQQTTGETVIVVDFHDVLFHLDLSSRGILQIVRGTVSALKNLGKQLINYPGDLQRWKEAATPINPQRPAREVIAALREAKDAGCRIVLFSNITPGEYEERIREHPELQLPYLFDEEVRLSELNTRPNGYLIHKGDLEFHRACAELLARKYGSSAQIAFFDDKQENLVRFQQACQERSLSCDIRRAVSPEQSVRDIRAIIAQRKRARATAMPSS